MLISCKHVPHFQPKTSDPKKVVYFSSFLLDNEKVIDEEKYFPWA